MTLLETKPDASIPADIAGDIAKFETMLDRYLEGQLEEDVFRAFRLANGVYGQRQGGSTRCCGSGSRTEG